MKKIFTLMAAAIASLAASAQDFQLYFGDKPVENGATYEIGYKAEAYDFGDYGKGVEVKQDANLFFHAAPGTQASVTVELLTEDGSIKVCSLGAVCDYLPNKGSYVITKSGAVTKDMESAMIDADYLYENVTEVPADNDIKAMEVKVTATSGTYSATVTVKLLDTPATLSIAAAEISTDYIRSVAGNTLNYSVSQPTTLNIYAITGNLVSKHQIAGAGSLNLGALPKGIYIYTDGMAHKGKIVVR